ncbi:MAG: 4-oxalmesaconate hydratase [Pseudonocardiales bacterium]|jgi:4-oxalmesaconate hydratase|nr:4-oxalmesaconate hydratase [Pseudonocardiales bacterium]MDT4946173.1 4-oxalmesaconate hydratase [Pseudonocardiales bacterium]
MIIDVHGHFTQVPPELDAYRGRQIMQLSRPRGRGDAGISDDNLREHLQPHVTQTRERGIDRIIWGPRAAFMGHEFGPEWISRFWTEINNDLIARTVEMYPDLFLPAFQLPQSPGVAPAASIPEIERCAAMGFVSCQINPDPSGGAAPLSPSLGDRSWYPLYEKLCEYDIVGLIHAANTLNPHLHMNGAHYVNTDVAAVVEFTTSKVFKDFPELKIVIPHAGGGIPFHWNRMRAIHTESRLEPFEDAVRNLYFDLSTYDPESIELTIKKMGADNIVYASEMWGSAKAVDPLTGRKFDDNLHMVTDIEWLTDDDRYKILEGNARKLYSRAKF